MALDTQYYSSRDPRSMMTPVGLSARCAMSRDHARHDLSILSAAMQKMGRLDLPGGSTVQEKIFSFTQHGQFASLPPLSASPTVPWSRRRLLRGRRRQVQSPALFHHSQCDRAQLEKAAKELGIKIHSTSGGLSVKTHALAVPRVALVHNCRTLRMMAGSAFPMEELKVPYTYVAEHLLRENQKPPRKV